MVSSSTTIPIRQKIISLIVTILCLGVQILPSVRSGLMYSYGYGFWGPNGHDGIWHLSLINHITNPLKIDIPAFSGNILNNYHPFFDILIAIIHRLTGISSSLLLFQLVPIIFSLIILYISYLIGKKITNSFSGGIYLMLFNTFATSFGWIVTLLREGRFAGESLFWSMQSFSTFLNPPFALSLIFVLYLIYILLNNPILTLKNYLFIFLILILSPITKAYSIIPIFTIFGLYSFRKFLNHQGYSLLFFIISSIISYIIFRHYNSDSTVLFEWQPFWLVSGMFQSTDRLYFPKVAGAIFNLSAGSAFNLKLLLINLIGSAIFIIGNFGFRIIGFLSIRTPHFHSNIRDIYWVVILTIIIPLIFIQQGTGWNIIQFLYYGLFLANILMIYYLYQLKDKKLKYLYINIILALNILGNIDNIKNYFGNPAPANLPISEIRALAFLDQQKPGIVLTYPFDPEIKKKLSTPIPLYAYETSSYISAYTRHQTYLSDEMNLANSRYNWVNRRDNEIRFFEKKDINEDRGFLLNNQIDYIYLTGLQVSRVNLDIEHLFLKYIYNDGQTIIFQVIK